MQFDHSKLCNNNSKPTVGEGSLVIKDPFLNEDEKTREIGTQTGYIEILIPE